MGQFRTGFDIFSLRVCETRGDIKTVAGMVCSLMVETVGFRRLCMLGNSMIVAGLISTAFARNITIVFFSYSILIGNFLPFKSGLKGNEKRGKSS